MESHLADEDLCTDVYRRLQTNRKHDLNSQAERCDPIDDETFSQKSQLVISHAIPSIATMYLWQAQTVINLIFVGHYGNEAMIAGVGMGNMINNILGSSLCLGMNGAVETLVSQSFGAKNLQLCGQYMNRGRIILLLMFIPIALILNQSDRILLAIKQDSQVSMYAQQYIKVYMPGLLLNGLNDGQRRFLNCLGYSKIPMFFQTLGILLQIILSYIFTVQMDMGIQGIGIACSLSNLLIYIGNLIYPIFISEIQEAIFLPNRHSFRGFRKYFEIGIPSCLILCLEWWAFEAMTLISGYLGVDSQASQIVIFNILGFLFMLPLGLQATAASTIGTQIGANNVQKAKQYYVVNSSISMFLILIATGLFLIFHKPVIATFTGLQNIREMCNSVLYVVGIFTVQDMWCGYLNGVVRSIGAQERVIYINFLGYWILYPIVVYILLVKYSLGFAGLWAALTIAQFFICSSLHYLIDFSDWQILADEATERQKQEMLIIEKLKNYKLEVDENDFTRIT